MQSTQRGGEPWRRAARRLVVACAIVIPASLGFTQEPEWVSFETTDQTALPIVRARLNGSEGYRLVIDVSFIDNVLDNTLVAGSGMELASRNEQKTIDYYGSEEDVPIAYLSSLSIGNVDFQTVPALIVEGDDTTILGGIRSYGRIGRETLSPLRLTIHYPRGLLLLDRSPPDPVPAGGVTFSSEGRFLQVPVTVTTPVGPKTIPFVFDAGASSTVLDRRWAAKQELAPRGGLTAKIETLTIGGLMEEDMTVPLGDLRELPYGGSPLGILGTDLMRRLSVTFDFPRNLVWLEPVESPEASAPSGANR